MPANSNSFSSRHNTSANARRQESVQKETESTASTVDPSQGSSSNVQGDNQTGYSYPVSHGYGDAMVAGNSYPAKTRQQQQGTQSKSQAGTTQSYDWGESTELEAQPAQFLPQTLQDNSRARPTSTMEEVSALLSRPSPFAPLDLHRSSTSTTSLIHPRLAQDSRHQFQTPTSSATHMSFQSSDRRQSLACSSSNSPYHASVSPTSRLPPSNPPSPPQMTSFSNGHHILPLLPSISSPPRTRSSPTDCFRPFTSSSHPQMDASSNYLSPSTLSAAAPPAKDHSTIASSSSSYRTNNGTPRAVLLLLDFDLWAKFHKQKNEMIITNPGRCLFPRLRFKAVNLDPEAYYGIRVDFAMVTPESLRFDGEVGDWKPHETLGDSSGGHYSQDSNGPSGGGSNNRHESYLHPDGFKPGSHWMADTISCTKVKLTNEDEDEDESMSTTTTKKKRSAKPKSSSTNTNSNHNDPSHGDRSTANDINTGFFHVKSFHKYIPRIHLLQRDKDSGAITSSTEFRYKTTEFMAVTHYQNYKVNDLKKLHNPHAKGIGEKLSPPVKIPSESPSSSSTALRSQTKKRSRSERQSSQSDSDGTEDEDHDRDGSGELEVAVDTSTSGTSSSGNKKRVRLSPASKVKAPSVNNARMHMPDGGHSNMYRIDKDNNTLATTSLGRGPSADAKVSEQTSRHHFSQQASSNG
ncbi:T-box brain protein 1, partial [Mortierella sp. NVP41]